MFIYETHHLVSVRATPRVLGRRGWVGVVCWVKCDQKKASFHQLFCNKSCKQGNECPMPRAGAATLPKNCQGTAVRHTLGRGNSSSAEALTAVGCQDRVPSSSSLELLLVAARTTLLRRMVPQWTHTGGKNYVQLHTQLSPVVPGCCNQLQRPS